MRPLLPGPCAHWAELLDAHPEHLSPAERAALDAHIATCPACAAVFEDNQYMDARIRSLPDPAPLPGLPPGLLALWEEEDRHKPVPYHLISLRLAEKHMQTNHTAPGLSVPAHSPIPPARHIHRRRLVSVISTIAAVLVIAIVVTALFASRAGKPATTGHGGNQKPTPTPGSQGWVNVPALRNSHKQPIIAPSDPQIIYEFDQHLHILQRSDNDGATWKNLSSPPGDTALAQLASLMVNQRNARNVFLSVTYSSCSTTQASAGQFVGYAGGGGCSVLYASTDGGDHWQRSTSGAQGAVSMVGSIVAQGDHLYALSFDSDQHEHLNISRDSGLTWQPDDTTLLAQGQGFCSFAAAPTGSTVFAFAQASSCSQPVGYLAKSSSSAQAQSALTVWRSDDAGAHWVQAGTFPYESPDTQAFLALGNDTGQPLLVGAAGIGASYTRVISTDGGATWQALPEQGLPGSVTSGFFARTALSDGSLLSAQSTQGGSAFYAWKPGDQAWHQITPAFTGSPSDPIVVSSAAGQDTIWLVTDNNGVFTVAHCQAQAQNAPTGSGEQQGTSPITKVATSKSYTPGDALWKPTNTFKQGEQVYVLWQVSGAKAGDKLLIKWYLNGSAFDQGNQGNRVTGYVFSADGDFNGAFSEVYPSAGSGKAELYWNGQLAWTIQFTITH